MPVPLRPSHSYSVRPSFTWVRRPSRRCLSGATSIARPTKRRLAPRCVTCVGDERALAAELGIELGLRLAGLDRGELAVAHHEAARDLAAVTGSDVVEDEEVVRVGDHAEPAPVGDALPVAHAPGVVAHPAPGERVAAAADLDRARDRAGLLVVGARDALGQPRAERERVVPGGEAKGGMDLDRLVGVTLRGDVLGALVQATRALEADLPERQRQGAFVANRPGLGRSIDARAGKGFPGEAEEEPLPREPEPERPLRDLLVRTPADPRIKRETAPVAAAEVEGVRPLLVVTRLLPALAGGCDLGGDPDGHAGRSLPERSGRYLLRLRRSSSDCPSVSTKTSTVKKIISP